MIKNAITCGLLTAIFSSALLAQDSSTTSPLTEQPFDQFYDDKERGWFWYEETPEPEKEEVPPPVPSNQPTVIPNNDLAVQTERPLSQSWFRENFAKYRDKAIENPHDQEAMRTYLYLEKYMTDRAMAFGYERMKTIYSDPFLDSTSRRSTANFGMRAMNIDSANQQKETLSALAKASGIVFFFRSDDAYSAQQAPLLMNISKHYGFDIKPVSIDGANLENSPWTDDMVAVNQGQAEALNVQKLPAMYLFVAETAQFEMIAQGLQAQTQLEQRIMYAAHRGQLISDSEFNAMKAAGLYQSLDGTTGVVGVPSNAPQEFLNLYLQSQGR